MKMNIRGDKVLITNSIKEYIESKLVKLEKYFDNTNLNANIVVRLRGRNQIIEVTIPTKHFTLRAEEGHDDLYAAIDLVSDKLERQIRKNKTRLEKKLRKESSKDLHFEYIEELFEEEKNEIVKRKKIEMKPMNEEEAILQMDLLGHEFFIFRDVDSDNVCVVYRRKDNNYGIIEID